MNPGGPRMQILRKPAAGAVPAKPAPGRPAAQPGSAGRPSGAVKKGPGAGISKRMVFGG